MLATYNLGTHTCIYTLLGVCVPPWTCSGTTALQAARQSKAARAASTPFGLTSIENPASVSDSFRQVLGLRSQRGNGPTRSHIKE